MNLTRRNFVGLLAGALVASACPQILIPKDGSKSIVPARPQLPRKLKAVWTIEAEQDLQAYYNIRADNFYNEILDKELTKRKKFSWFIGRESKFTSSYIEV